MSGTSPEYSAVLAVVVFGINPPLEIRGNIEMFSTWVFNMFRFNQRFDVNLNPPPSSDLSTPLPESPHFSPCMYLCNGIFGCVRKVWAHLCGRPSVGVSRRACEPPPCGDGGPRQRQMDLQAVACRRCRYRKSLGRLGRGLILASPFFVYTGKIFRPTKKKIRGLVNSDKIKYRKKKTILRPCDLTQLPSVNRAAAPPEGTVSTPRRALSRARPHAARSMVYTRRQIIVSTGRACVLLHEPVCVYYYACTQWLMVSGGFWTASFRLLSLRRASPLRASIALALSLPLTRQRYLSDKFSIFFLPPTFRRQKNIDYWQPLAAPFHADPACHTARRKEKVINFTLAVSRSQTRRKRVELTRS